MIAKETRAGLSLTLTLLLAACGGEDPSKSDSTSASSGSQGDSTANSTTGSAATTNPDASTALTSTAGNTASADSTTSAASTTGTPATSGDTSASSTTASSSGSSSTTDASATTDGGTTTSAATTDGGTTSSATTSSGDCTDSGAHEDFSFFVTSYHHIVDLSGSEDGFGGDLRYNGAATGLEGADAICQEIASRVCFGHRTWRAYLSTSTENAIDRIGAGPWYDYSGALLSENIAGLLAGDRPAGGAMDTGTYDELGVFHDGNTDVNGDNVDDDDHDTMTATLADGTYAGFSCDDWTSTSATDESGGGEQGGPGGGPGGGNSGGIMMGHSWPAMSGQHWAQSHGGHQCAAGVNFRQDGGGDSSTVGGGGGYGGIYCFALAQ